MLHERRPHHVCDLYVAELFALAGRAALHALEGAAEHARKNAVGFAVATQEVSQTVHHERFAALTAHPLHGLDHVYVAADHQIDACVGKLLRLGLLRLARVVLVLLAPVHVHDHGIGHLARGRHVFLHAFRLVGHGVVLVGKLVLCVAVLAIGVREERKTQAVALDNTDLVPVGFVLVAADRQELIALFVPGLLRMLDARYPGVVRVVGVGVHHAPARIGHGIGHAIGRVVARIPVVAVGIVAAERGLLVHERDVIALDLLLYVLVEGRKVVSAVGGGARVGIGEVDDVLIGEVIAHGAEGHLAVTRLGGSAGVEHHGIGVSRVLARALDGG